MATKTRALKMPNGSEYEFFGATWYGECSTSGTTQAKTVSINGFTSSVLVAGVRVVVKFSNWQGYDGIPTLNVSGTGAKNIARNSRANPDYAQQAEWPPGGVIGFIYDGTNWVIENGQHGGSYYGTVKLTYEVDDSYDAVESSAVMRFGRDMVGLIWNGRDGGETGKTTILNTTTPPASQWDGEGDFRSVRYQISLPGSIDSTMSSIRMVRTYYDGILQYAVLPYKSDVSSYGYVSLLQYYKDSKYLYVSMYLDGNNSTIIVESDNPEYIGEKDLKVELIESQSQYGGYSPVNGLITYKQLEDKLSNYLTLADLPIYDGSSSPVTPSSP